MDPLEGDAKLASEQSSEHVGRFAVGLASRAASWIDLASGGSGTGSLPSAVDVALGAAQVTAQVATEVAQLGWRVTAPVRAVVSRPPFVPLAYQPSTIVAELGRRGRQYRQASELVADSAVSALVARLVPAILDEIDLTALVLQRVNLDTVVGAVDLDAAAASVNLDALMSGVDLDAVVAGVDLEAVVRRLDLDAIVAGVDVEAILARVDVNGVAERVDLQPIIDRLDLVGLASYVIDEIDLPEIIRESTGGVASEAVRGVRMQSIDADQAVQRTIDRILLRRKARATQAPGGDRTEVPVAPALPLPTPPLELSATEHQPIGAGTDR